MAKIKDGDFLHIHVTRTQAEFVKKMAKYKDVSQSGYIRMLIDNAREDTGKYRYPCTNERSAACDDCEYRTHPKFRCDLWLEDLKK